MPSWCDNHPWMTFFFACLALIVAAELAYSIFFRLPNRILRHRNISKQGWPPPYCDADGDFKETDVPEPTAVESLNRLRAECENNECMDYPYCTPAVADVRAVIEEVERLQRENAELIEQCKSMGDEIVGNKP